MATVKVWAPLAKEVLLQVGNEQLTMEATERGWWRCDAALVGHGTDYSFIVDGGNPLPDPRSAWQPAGVHGPSRWVDHGRFSWSDKGWQPPDWSAAIVYEMHVGTFTVAGSFEGAIERLDHLVSLGVTHVEIMPVGAFSGEHGWGYDGVDLYAPHQAYGGPDGLKALVDACHRRGLAVVLDVVYNHLGPSGNYLGQFGPYFTKKYSTPWGEAVNVDDAYSDEVRRFFIDNALMWMRDYHIDGLRLDAVHAIVDESAVHFFEQLAEETDQLSAQLGRKLILIAESNLNNPRLVQSRQTNGYGLHAQWSDDFHHAVHTQLTGEAEAYYSDFRSLADLGKVLQEGFVYDGCYSVFRQRSHGRPGSHLPPSTFVVAIQNHDQIGNRAVGERLHHLTGLPKAKIAAATMLLSPYVPMLFQGEEWAASTPFQYFTDHQDPELGEAVRYGRQHEFSAFGWNPEDVPDPQDRATFERSRLDWQELDKPEHREMLEWYRALIRLRREVSAITAGTLADSRVEVDAQQQRLVYGRGLVTLCINFSERLQVIPVSGIQDSDLVLASTPGTKVAANEVSLPALCAAIFRKS